MPSWNAPLLTNYIRNDVPAIQVLLHASARWNPEDPTTEICTDVQSGFKRLIEATQTDSTITKQVRFETYNGETWKSVGKLMHDVDTLDGYHASKTSSAENFIPVYNANKKIAGGAEGEAGKAIQLTTARSIDVGGIASADAQQFDGTQDIVIPINTITVNNEGDSALNGIVTEAHGGTGNAYGYASDVQMEDSSAGQVLALQYGQLGESKLVNSTNIKSLVVPGNYISRTVNTDYGFPYTDSSLTAYINVSKSGNSIIQRINMGGNNLWVNTSNNGGASWLGLKPIGGAKQGSLTIYVSKSGSALNSGFDPASPILSIEHAIQIFYDFGRGYSNAECRLCVGEGDWGSFTFRGLPFDLSIYPFDGLPATEYTNSLPRFHGLSALFGTTLYLSGVVSDFVLTHAGTVHITDYCRIGAIRAVNHGFIHLDATATFGVFQNSNFTTAVFYAAESGLIQVSNECKIRIEENIAVTQFLYSSSNGRIFFNYTPGIPITQIGTVTGKRFTVGTQSYLFGGTSSAFDWNTYLPGTTAGTFAVNAIINGIPYGGGDKDTFLCADRTWKKVTTLPSLNVTGDTVLNGKLTVKGDFIIGTTSFLDKVYPVGSIYMSVNSISPATLFGGTWEAIAGGRVLMGANSTYTLGSTGGAYTHTLSTTEIPAHKHSGSTAGAGGHSHSAGSYAASGSFSQSDNAGLYSDYVNAAGCCSASGWNDWRTRCTNGGIRGATTLSININSGTLGGATSQIANHTHGVTINNTGGGGAHNNVQPYLVVNMWKRTA